MRGPKVDGSTGARPKWKFENFHRDESPECSDPPSSPAAALGKGPEVVVLVERWIPAGATPV